MVHPSPRSRASRSSSAFIWWPREYVPTDEEGSQLYALYTPIIGFTFGLVGPRASGSASSPGEEDPSPGGRHPAAPRRACPAEVDRRTAAARLVRPVEQSGIARRKLIRGRSVPAGGASASGPSCADSRRPDQEPVGGGPGLAAAGHPVGRRDGKQVYLRRNTGVPDEGVRSGPTTWSPARMETVFPSGVRRRTPRPSPRRARPTAGDAVPPAPERERRQAGGPGGLRVRRLLRLLEDLHATSAARCRCTSSRPIGCSARATSRSSMRTSTPSPSSARPPVRCRNCPSGGRRGILRRRAATSSKRSVRGSGSEAHEFDHHRTRRAKACAMKLAGTAADEASTSRHPTRRAASVGR